MFPMFMKRFDPLVRTVMNFLLKGNVQWCRGRSKLCLQVNLQSLVVRSTFLKSVALSWRRLSNTCTTEWNIQTAKSPSRNSRLSQRSPSSCLWLQITSIANWSARGRTSTLLVQLIHSYEQPAPSRNVFSWYFSVFVPCVACVQPQLRCIWMRW